MATAESLPLDAESLRAAYEQDLNRVLTRTGKRKNIELIQVSYNELLKSWEAARK